ncbi:hypothetical protein GWO43_17650 [candidate division KSB1 bacterium]|nr:hypothetical protein [candidate division KSB1 bacterium]NIR69798.1 hypothetical protein [candidate division KSB1 bacterium]NIS25788.1 hypothetical protein [candidate division KSB1 bacterium]NIT72662.1 hypothetical protein [candidate division KSB1 bacterium]NIU26477.1 hypothetical protein [candidate division KSB1 bacterium]
MKRLLQKVINIREGEGTRVGIMAGYVFVIIASYNVLKPMTRSLFVSKLGLEQLPILYILLALVVGVVVIFYLRVSSNRRLDRLINGTNLFLMSNLLLFRWLLGLNVDSAWLFYSLFIWASIYGVLTTTQFWLLANHLFNAREARRLFPVLTSFAILGGIAGGYFTRFLVKQIGGTANLAFVCMALLATTIVLMNLAWQHREPSVERTRRAQPSPPKQSFRIVGEVVTLIRNSRHLALLMGIISLTFLVVQIVDFQFVAFASQANAGTDDLTGFLGFWVSTMSVLALLFQLFFTNMIIRRFGVGVTILFLPVALLLCSVWVFLSYGLISILAIKLGDGAFRHSINKVGTELLYLPISTEVKNKTKAFVDMFADRFARGLAGVLLLIAYSWMGLSVAQISLISIVMISIWVGLSFSTYREYVNSFRQALAKRRINADELINVSINDEETINSLIISLASRNERQVVYALKMLESVKGVELIPPTVPLLEHPSADVRLHALHLLRQQKDSDLKLWPNVAPLLYDENVEVRREAVRFYATYAKDADEKLAEWLKHEDSRLRGAVLYYIAEKPKLARKLLDRRLMRSFLKDGRDGRIQVADAIGILANQNYNSFLIELLEDSDSGVKMHAIRSVGQTHDPRFVSILIENLGDRNYRKVAREALAEYGDTITVTLSEYLRNERLSMNIRSGIPRVLSLIGGQQSVEVLLDNLNQEDDFLRYQVIKSMNKLRARFPNLNFDKRVDAALLDELKKYLRILAALHVTDSSNGNGSNPNGSSLLARVLQERLDDHLDRIFRLLGLRYPPRDIYNAYAATISQNRRIRANAVEFLDNILSNNLKRVLIPIVEELPPEQVLQQANGLSDVEFHCQKEALEALVFDSDPWIRACTIFEIGKCGLIDEFRAVIAQAKKAEDSLVQETASLVLKQFA